MDELTPEETLKWIAERQERLRAQYGPGGVRPIRDKQEALTHFKINVAEVEAHIAILKKELAALTPGRLNSMDEELRIRAEIAEMEGWRAKMQVHVDDIVREIAEKAKKP